MNIVVRDETPILRILEVLYVEDEDLVSAITHRSIAHAANVDVVTSLRDAIKFLSNKIYDAVLLDLGLPDASATSGIEEIHRQYPETPIVVLTAAADNYDEQAQQALAAGASWWVEKGACARDIIRALRLAIFQAKLGQLKRAVAGGALEFE